MIKLFKIFLVSFIFLGINSVLKAETGKATVYKIIMKKIELCESSTGVDNCVGAVVLAERDLEIDIASVDAGTAAAAYGDTALLPLGTTYTHMRVTISRKFTISADITVAGISTPCRTYADAKYPGDHAAAGNEIHTHRPAMTPNTTQAEMVSYLVNDQFTICTAANCGSVANDQDLNYAQGTGSSTFQTQHADGSTDTDHVMIYTLTAPYTVALIAPVLDISFKTEAAVNASEIASTNLCNIEPVEPIVAISIQ
ncbi:hypothetical protein ABXT48_04620 [Candidatus Pelagibacter sp. Uisw_101]|jgi:hypothetical protein|uniref:hypothetical protein n=1 Tax=Candidatus Pelagibacter sp. Uisw_101 TaxID=3230982 RepID=UPI0039EB88A6|tara:strand:- start:123 stop:887 length:765 start_codon:yes stop_codon:yes gene_type:complete